jgi:hypothetical protein
MSPDIDVLPWLQQSCAEESCRGCWDNASDQTLAARGSHAVKMTGPQNGGQGHRGIFVNAQEIKRKSHPEHRIKP